MIIFFCKGLSRNLKIGNTPVWVFPSIWRLEQYRDTKFGTDVSNNILLNGTKFQGYNFYRFWVITGKPTSGVKSPPSSPIQIRVKYLSLSGSWFIILINAFVFPDSEPPFINFLYGWSGFLANLDYVLLDLPLWYNRSCNINNFVLFH